MYKLTKSSTEVFPSFISLEMHKSTRQNRTRRERLRSAWTDSDKLEAGSTASLSNSDVVKDCNISHQMTVIYIKLRD